MDYDNRTGYPKLEKTVYANKTFAFDFGPQLEDNTITTITSVSATNQGLISGSGALTVGSTNISGSLAQVQLSGGADGENYLMEAKITDSAGNLLNMFGILEVRD